MTRKNCWSRIENW